MNKKAIYSILSVIVAMVVLSVSLVFAIGPRVSADSEEDRIVVLDKWDDFVIDDNGVLNGLSENVLNQFTYYVENNCTGNLDFYVKDEVDELRIFVPEGVKGVEGFGISGDCYEDIRRCITVVELPKGLESIGPSAFYNFTSINEIEIPEGVINIGESAFYKCENLTSLTIPDSVTTIGQRAFSYSGLTSVVIPNKITVIEDYTFMGCYNLASVTIPDSVTIIGGFAFSDCDLTSVMIPESVTKISGYAFEYNRFTTNITIPESVTYIGEWAFHDGVDCEMIRIPKNVTYVGYGAFCGRNGNFNDERYSRAAVKCECSKEFADENWDENWDLNYWFYSQQSHYSDIEWNYNIPECTVNYNTMGGTAVPSRTVDENNIIMAPTTEKVGYKLVGWYTDDQFATKFNFGTTPITEDITLYAQWQLNEYTARFESNGGSMIDNQTINHGACVIKPTDPTRTNYTFKGWYNGETAYDFTTPVTNNVTLTAHWEAISEPEQPEPETPAEENSTEVNNQNNNALVWGIAGTAAGILVIGGLVAGVVIAKRRRK